MPPPSSGCTSPNESSRRILAAITLLGMLLNGPSAVGGPGPGGAPEGWPESVTAQVGDLGIRFESRSFWTLYRIDYRGKRLCLDRWGSHYGSVAKFPGVGFIGSGHTENADETLLSVSLEIDGSRVPTPPANVDCDRIRLVKQARIRTLTLETVIDVQRGRIRESVRVRADEATPVDLIYHFMHPWTPAMDAFMAEGLDGMRLEGRFDDDRAMEVDRQTRWSAVYSTSLHAGAVTRVIQAPPSHWRTRYWDVPERYRKHYFTTYLNKTVPAATELCYEIIVSPFEAAPDNWQETAASVADALTPFASGPAE